MACMADPTTKPFARVKIRTGALVFCGDDIALIRRDRSTGSHYTPPGGNVDATLSCRRSPTRTTRGSDHR